MGSDPTSIWERSGPRARRPRPSPTPPTTPHVPGPRRAADERPIEERFVERRPTAAPATAPARIALKEASRRYGVSIAALRLWCRAGEVDAVMEGGRWMVAPASVAARRRRAAGGAGRAPGPSPDGSAMLVPRDAWDRLLAQLGHLHEAGQQLAEARERAAKAETEAGFLRERLAEMRRERDEMKQRLDPPPAPAPRSPRPHRPFRFLRRRRPS